MMTSRIGGGCRGCYTLTLKDVFLILVSLTLVLMGIGHFLVNHQLIPRHLYKDAELTEAMDDLEQRSWKDDTSEADALFDSVRVVCMVMSSRETLWTRAVHVNATWGRRCNRLLFMTEVADPLFPEAIGVYPSTGRQHLTQKVFESLDYVYDHHYKDADWFLKCDDDTYVIMENLRHFLSDKSSSDLYFYGQQFRNTKLLNYFTGGAGYVLSRKALKLFRTRDKDVCKATWEGANEDVRTSDCLSQLGVKMGSSLDNNGRTRFHAFPPWTHLQGDYPTWYKFRSVWGVHKGVTGLSPLAVSFHKFESSDYLYLMEYVVYHLRPFGIHFRQTEDARNYDVTMEDLT